MESEGGEEVESSGEGTMIPQGSDCLLVLEMKICKTCSCT